jgi:hypothetical protein
VEQPYESWDGDDLDLDTWCWDKYDAFHGEHDPDPVYEDEFDCDECWSMFSDACAGCPGYARRMSEMDPTGVYNSEGECIGSLEPLHLPF